MPDYHAAFSAGEFVRLAHVEGLKKLQDQFGSHHLTPPDMHFQACRKVRIRSVSYYHGGTALYELDEVPGFWLEAALVDLCFDRDYTQAIYQPAYHVYLASSEALSGSGSVHIRDKSGKLFCSLYRSDAPQSVTDINAVAQIRARGSFEDRYNFDGVYE